MISQLPDNGVLELSLPKREEVRAKKIEVKAQFPEVEIKKREQKPRQQRVNHAVVG